MSDTETILRAQINKLRAESAHALERYAAVERERDEARATCASMRQCWRDLGELLTFSEKWIHDATEWESNDVLGPRWQALWHAWPTTDVGAGWVPPEVAEQMADTLRSFRQHSDTWAKERIDRALAVYEKARKP